LALKNTRITKALSDVLLTLYTETNRRQGIEKGEELGAAIVEQLTLVEYLRVEIQNVTLGAMTGRKRKRLAPQDVTLPRLVISRGAWRFDVGRPPSRMALALRKLLRQRIRPILEDDLPEQRLLYERMRQVDVASTMPLLDCWIQGEAENMSLVVLDARSGQSLLLEAGVTADEAVERFREWVGSRSATSST
jgi:hypothetical protein